ISSDTIGGNRKAAEANADSVHAGFVVLSTFQRNCVEVRKRSGLDGVGVRVGAEARNDGRKG
ncbi:hypothetical protein BaRGS_00012064, partial [Batillaria attramentaria]